MRVVKQAAGKKIHYVFEGTEPIFEKRITENKIRSYVYAFGKHVARIDGIIGDPNANTYWYTTDQVGSIKAVTNNTGTVVFNADYFAFGSKNLSTGDFDELHGFTGKEIDPDTGLYYYNARWYDSETGRFISEDPIGDPNNPNLYSYCANNPLINIDPLGLDVHNNYGIDPQDVQNGSGPTLPLDWNPPSSPPSSNPSNNNSSPGNNPTNTGNTSSTNDAYSDWVNRHFTDSEINWMLETFGRFETPGNGPHEVGIAFDVNGNGLGAQFDTFKNLAIQCRFSWEGPGDRCHFGIYQYEYNRIVEVRQAQNVYNNMNW